MDPNAPIPEKVYDPRQDLSLPEGQQYSQNGSDVAAVNPANTMGISGVAPVLVRSNPNVVVPPMAKKPVPTFDPKKADDVKEEDTPLQKRLKDLRGSKRRWARLQVSEKSSRRLQRAEGSDNYNIWYHKYYGDDDDRIREKATTRCRPELDSGMTLGDVADCKYICVHFARGCCTHGADCKFLHRLPTLADEQHISMLHDIFGRSRHADHSEDMGGVGSFEKNTRTLYITGMAVMQSPQGDEILARHFGQWGEIEEISLKPKYGCAFIRYTHRFWAEFAKIAMAEQSLDHGEQINVRWAYDDPNPKAQVRKKWETEQKLKDRLEELGYNLRGENVSYEMPAHYNPVFKQGVATYGRDMEMYPVTDHQYQAQQQAAQAAQAQGSAVDHYTSNAEWYKQYYDQYYAKHYQGVAAAQQQKQASVTTTTTRKRKAAGPAGPMTPEQMAMQEEKKKIEFEQRRQAKLANQYVKQQVNAMNKLDQALNLIDSVACYGQEQKAPSKQEPKVDAKAQYDAFMAGIQQASKKAKAS